MYKQIKYLILILLLSAVLPIHASENSTDWKLNVGAKSYPEPTHILQANNFGAVNNGLILSTKAIQQAIDSCSALGGGQVIFDKGTYLTGAIFLKSNVDLHIDEGVELRGIIDLEEYPEIDTRVAGIEMRWPSAIINVLDQENVAISGKGIIHAQGRYHWERYWKLRTAYTPRGLRWAADYDCKRVRTILVSNSKQVSLKNLTLKQAGFWTVHLLYSSNVSIDGLIIQNNIDGHGPSTDGIDIDSSSDVLVENCDIDCNDDNFCLKAGRDADGLRVNRPTENVIIRNCIARRGSGLFTIGSETSGGIRNVEVHHLVANGTTTGIRLKSALTRGGKVENIYVHNIEMENVSTPVEVTLNWNPTYSYASIKEDYDSIPAHWKALLQEVDPAQGIPVFQNVSLKDITASGAKQAVNASGLEDSYLQNFSWENVKISGSKSGTISYTKNWSFKNVTFNTADDAQLKLNHNQELETTDSKF